MNILIYTISAAFILDIIFGDPQYRLHPVRVLGKFISGSEALFRRLSKNQKINGFVFCLFIAGSAWSAVYFSNRLFSLLPSPWAEIVNLTFNIYIIYSCLSVKDLADQAREISCLLAAGKLQSAREKCALIVGRDTKNLDEKEIIRAVIETVAENFSDGVMAPLLFAFLGGAPLAFAFKAASTMDSMIGYKNSRYRDFGFTAARLDDILNYIPARLSVIFVQAAGMFLKITGHKIFTSALRTALQDGAKNPSPNSGYPEAAFAGLLGVKLGGINYYEGCESIKPFIGIMKKPFSIQLIDQSLRILYVSSFFSFLVLSVIFLLCGYSIEF
ncbi:MAG: cobalamin biosynthesis protein CobD [Spirochaetes bacterium GWF1_41_5]|nr:MAG: cobalamin biosynthesis protein CobD [Spirochaetes bacterium GWF1_41_5]HBE03852.1 cobalamin biosynthesis protein CobD [Spirochaetia bacterium]